MDAEKENTKGRKFSGLLIYGNFCQALKWINAHHCSPIVFCPKIHSLLQRSYFLQRFENIKKNCDEVIWVERCDLRNELARAKHWVVAGWPAPDEKAHLDQAQVTYRFLPHNSLLQDVGVSDWSYSSFSSFRRAVEKKGLPGHYEESFQYHDEGLQNRLDFYFGNPEYPKSYFETRNQLMGKSFSSQLSSFLACGALNVRFLYNKIKAFEARYGSNKSTYWLVFELLWREFFLYSGLFHGPALFCKKGVQGLEPPQPWLNPAPEAEWDLVFRDNDFMVCALKELRRTGFLSNRARQLFASVWVNDLRWDWREGAEFFERHLIDYDVYSNYGNWQYLAGVGHDPRGKRYFNVPSQLQRYDQEGQYMKFWKNQ